MSNPNAPSKPTLDESLAKISSAADQQAQEMQPNEVSFGVAEAAYLENEALKQQLKELQETHALRKEYLPKLFWLIVAWLSVVVLFVLAASLRWIVLSDSVLIAFITSTTVSVLGLFIVAARSSVVTSKAAIRGRLKTGQRRTSPGTKQREVFTLLSRACPV
jgi:hypothetical protein